MAERSCDTPLPKLPGYSVGQPMAASYTKKQTLMYKNGYAVPVPMGQEEEVAALQQQFDAMWSVPAVCAPPAAAASSTPKWVQFDKQVLRYFGWFGEPVPDSPLEAWRVRKVCLLVYLEDGTMQITEPTEPNSGIMQGTLVRRHKLPKEAGGQLDIADLAVGSSIKVYGREVHIVDADGFTREFACGQGIQLAPAQPYPANPLELALAAKSKPSGLSRSDPESPSKFAEALLGKEFNSKSLQQSLRGGEVLRFYCLWDDRKAEFGDRHLYKLHFFVADNTGEMMEVQEANSGRVGFPTFLKRSPLPKAVPAGTLPGQARLEPEQCYSPPDLRIGATLTVLGRPLLIYDCDDATRKWYMEHQGFTPELLAPIDVTEPAQALPVAELPPHTGIGSPEDSLQNCLKLVPKPAKKGPYKWAKLDNVVLRYQAVLEPAATGAQQAQRLVTVDRERRFVVSFYMADQTLSVYEPVLPNSGLQGGKFLERARVYKNGNKLAWYTEEDVKLGVVLDLYGRRFRLVGADAFTEQYLASNGGSA